jgi:hypothetical protein
MWLILGPFIGFVVFLFAAMGFAVYWGIIIGGLVIVGLFWLCVYMYQQMGMKSLWYMFLWFVAIFNIVMIIKSC